MSRRRRFDLGSLLAGLLFVGLGVLFILRERLGLGFTPGWVLPVLLIGLGVAGVGWLLTRRGRREYESAGNGGPEEHSPSGRGRGTNGG